ncbi:hypothetical protein [Leisingera sp. JC11]|uniref:hypothetical protein n=1 Tax=Leisingera sp. JC11 TaxID=3042469 RepID=UPI0034562B94
MQMEAAGQAACRRNAAFRIGGLTILHGLRYISFTFLNIYLFQINHLRNDSDQGGGCSTFPWWRWQR